MSSDHNATFPDIGRLEQILDLTDALLGPEAAVDEIAARICQLSVHVVGAAAARLVGRRPDGILQVIARYGTDEIAAVSADAVAQALDAGRPALLHHEDASGPAVLTVPLRNGAQTTVLQLQARAAEPFSLGRVALARYVASLAVRALAQSAARARLTRTAESRSEALIALAHDVRTPLNAIIGYAQVVTDEACGPCTPEQRTALGTIERQAVELLSMLRGALEIAHLEAQAEAAAPDEFSLHEVLRELCTEAMARRTPNGVRLAWSVDPGVQPIKGDRFRIRQILQNLVDNALRFTDHGDVSVDALPHDGGVRLIVSDTGSGIDRAALPMLFEPFRSGSSERSGSGCGLYLVKRFSETLGGRVSVDSTPGRGTRFTVDLPLGS